MPRVGNVPENLRPYQFHGVDIDYREGADNAIGDCPFCGREGKFSVTVENGLWRCYVCNEGADSGKVYRGGNVFTFLRMLWERSLAATTEDYRAMSVERRLLSPPTLEEWGVRRSLLTAEWIVPGWGANGRIATLYRYVEDPTTSPLRRRLLATATLEHGLFGLHLLPSSADTIYVTEGPWDAMALWEVLGRVKRGSGGSEGGGNFEMAGGPAASLLANSGVIAVPGCSTFEEGWAPLLAGKRVVLLYDNDYPRLRCPPCKTSWTTAEGSKCPKCRRTTGLIQVPAAGYEGMKRVASLLSAATDPPRELTFLRWGKEGETYDPTLPAGTDVRDFLSAGERGTSANVHLRSHHLSRLLGKVHPIPAEWVGGRTARAIRSGSLLLEPKPCSTWKELVSACRKALKWIPGLDYALSIELAVIASTETQGDQLWARIVSPPSSGKTELAEALSIARKYVLPKDSFTGLFSGYQVDKEGSEDLSIAVQAKGKTLIIKDGDTILQLPNRDQILSQLRSMYDRSYRTSFRNRMSRDHEGLDTTVLLNGTASLRLLDTSELGERMLTVEITDKMDEEMEHDIARRKVFQAFRDVTRLSDGKPESRESPEKLLMKQLTGGYVEYLRKNAITLLGGVEETDADGDRCIALGTFVAFMRSRPSKSQEELAQRELSFRLASQFARLSKCLAVVLNRKTLDAEVMRRVRQVALDSAKGRVFTLAGILYAAGSTGVETPSIAHATNHPEDKERVYLRHMLAIDAVELFRPLGKEGKPGRPRWRLTPRLRTLWGEVVEGILSVGIIEESE